MKKNPQIIWTLVILIMGGIAWWLFGFSGKKLNITENTSNPQIKPDEFVPLSEGQSVETNFTDKTFKHTILGFSFSYQKSYNISSFGNYYDSNGQTILLQKEGGGDGLQVLITPFDEDISLTPSRIKKDIPTLHVLNPEEKMVGGESGVKIVVFSSDNNLSTGKSLEGWFISRGNLYQVSSPEASKELFEKIISTWKLEG